MRYLFIIISFLSTGFGFAQNTIHYYDSSWKPVSKEAAVYSKEIAKEGDKYKAIYYWARTGTVKSILFYSDSTLKTRSGPENNFYENGLLKDSSIYEESGVMKEIYCYYPDGKKWAFYSYNPGTKKDITKGWDSAGNLIKGFIYMREAQYPGGEEEWRSFLGRKIKPNTPNKNGAPNGSYQVMLRFIIDAEGNVVDVSPETNFGYGMEEEVMRVIKKSKKWTPGIKLNTPVKSFRRQPITFVVQ